MIRSNDTAVATGAVRLFDANRFERRVRRSIAGRVVAALVEELHDGYPQRDQRSHPRASFTNDFGDFGAGGRTFFARSFHDRQELVSHHLDLSVWVVRRAAWVARRRETFRNGPLPAGDNRSENVRAPPSRIEYPAREYYGK